MSQAIALPAEDRSQTNLAFRLNRALFAPIDIEMLVLFRVVFGACMLIEVCRFFYYGWIDSAYVNPPMHFTYYGFHWVRPLSSGPMHVFFGALGVCALLLMVGLAYRVAATLFFVGITYVFLIDQALYLNHMYLICLLSFLLIFLPANRLYSVDARIRPSIRAATVPAWTLWLLRFQVGLAYIGGGIAKLNPDWFTGVPMQNMMIKEVGFPLIGQYFDQNWMVYLYAYGGILFDLFIVALLLWSPTRTPAYFFTVIFHTSNAKMFQIGIFPLLMVAASMIYFPPETLRPQSRQAPDPGAAPMWSSSRKVTLWLLGLWVAFQVLVPLRHVLYPGDVAWTEEGHRFSWRMKLRTKRGTTAFRAVDAQGNPLPITPSPEEELTARQLRIMNGRPDMTLQYAHRIADRLRATGHPDVRVYVDTAVTLNGRDPQPLIDPQVDLSRVRRSLLHNDWIVPLHNPIPTLEEFRRRKREADDALDD